MIPAVEKKRRIMRPRVYKVKIKAWIVPNPSDEFQTGDPGFGRKLRRKRASEAKLSSLTPGLQCSKCCKFSNVGIWVLTPVERHEPRFDIRKSLVIPADLKNS